MVLFREGECFMDKKKILNILFFIIIAFFALYLRLQYVHADFWYDEACSWFTAKQSFPMGIVHNLLTLDLQHTPLYFFVLHFWMKMFGDSEFPLRILSLIFGIGTIPLVYTAAKKITSKTVSLFCTALATVSPVLVLFSVEVRMYSVVVFLVMLALNYLIDFENNNSTKSLVKLVVADLLIPYTLVGGFLYNLSVYFCYGTYLFRNKREDFFKYLKAVGIEIVALIPYFYLISYYAKMRSLFVISHEGELKFFQIVDVVRNYFGVLMTDNIYWPADKPYLLTVFFTLLVIVPCVYFVIGIVRGFKTENKFLKTLYSIFVTSFCLSVIFSLFKVNIFTVRYVLYLLPPLFILSVIGLFKSLSRKHCIIFLSLFIISSVIYLHYNAPIFNSLKTKALKTVRLEADDLELGADDMVIMPFASDAPYYFRDLLSPRVFDFDFHKEVRNPYNSHYYDKNQQKLMAGLMKSKPVYFAIKSDGVFSKAYADYFYENVNMTVPQGRFVLVALYGTDANSLVTVDELKNSVNLEDEVNSRFIELMLKKYMLDTRALLNINFNLIKVYPRDNFTFLLYQKK